MYNYEIISNINVLSPSRSTKGRVNIFIPEHAPYPTKEEAITSAENRLDELFSVLETLKDWKPEYRNQFEVRLKEA